jgi:hypothetical protein
LTPFGFAQPAPSEAEGGKPLRTDVPGEIICSFHLLKWYESVAMPNFDGITRDEVDERFFVSRVPLIDAESRKIIVK